MFGFKKKSQINTHQVFVYADLFVSTTAIWKHQVI